MELDGREKKEKEIEDILAGRKRPQQDGEDQQDDLEAAASPIIPPVMIQSVPRGLALPTIEEHTTYEVILGHSLHHGEGEEDDDDDEDVYGDGVGDEDEEESFSFLSETFPSLHEEETNHRSEKSSMKSVPSLLFSSSSSSSDLNAHGKHGRSDSSNSSDSFD